MIERSESITKLLEALNAARKQFAKVLKDKEAVVPIKTGGAYRYKYADLANVLEATDPAMIENGLNVLQVPCARNEGPALQTILTHVSGEWLSDYMLLPKTDATPQQLGSVITYCRRYAYCAILGIASEDDDGAEAEKAAQKAKAAKEAKGAAKEPTISEEQRKELFAAFKESGMPKEEMEQLLQNVAGVTASRNLPDKHFKAVMTAVKEGIRAK
jgi:hypothetical protein